MSDIQSQISDIQSQLESAYPTDEARALAWWIAEETTGLSRSQLLCDRKGTTFFSNTQELQTIIDRLLRFEPVQYIFGHTLWYGLDLLVNPATLIPRPETAELVEKIINHKFEVIVPQGKEIINCRVLDIGTGSGSIAIALKKNHPEWQVTGIDISPEAIDIARQNAIRNNVEVDFHVADIFNDQITNSYDIVVSNPPYICEHERATMRPNVLRYEPASALFVPDDDPLLFYRRIAQLHLGKHLFFECNEACTEQLQTLLGQLNYTDILISNDSYGKPRFIQCRMA